MHIEIFTLCESATSHNGALNITKTFDTIWTNGVPLRRPCYVAIRIRFLGSEIGRHSFKLRFVAPDGQTAYNMEGYFDALHAADEFSGTSYVCFHLDKLVLPSFGRYSVLLFVDDLELFSTPLLIKKLQPS